MVTRDQAERKVFRLVIALWYYVNGVVVVLVLCTHNLNPNLNRMTYSLNTAAAASLEWLKYSTLEPTKGNPRVYQIFVVVIYIRVGMGLGPWLQSTRGALNKKN